MLMISPACNESDIMDAATHGEGIGRSVLRKEDDRYLRGRGQFVADIRLPGMQELAFVRSPLGHARIRGIRKPAGSESAVFVAADLAGVKPITANSTLPGFKPSSQHVHWRPTASAMWAKPIAVCVAATRAEAEDLAECRSRWISRNCPRLADMLAGRATGRAAVA